MRLAPLAVLALLSAAACATIMHGTNQNVGIGSSPTGAKVTVDGKLLGGTTPAVIQLARKDHHVVKLELDGYAPFEGPITRQVSGWVWGNIVFGGLIGLAVDAISGGLYKLTPEQVAGQLAVTEGPKPDALYVFVVLKPDPAWTRIGDLARE